MPGSVAAQPMSASDSKISLLTHTKITNEGYPRPARNAAELERGRTSIQMSLMFIARGVSRKHPRQKNRRAASATASATPVPAPKDQKPCRLIHGSLAHRAQPFLRLPPLAQCLHFLSSQQVRFQAQVAVSHKPAVHKDTRLCVLWPLQSPCFVL